MHELHKDIPIYHTVNSLSMNQISTIDGSGADSREYTVGTSRGTHIKDAPGFPAEVYAIVPKNE